MKENCVYIMSSKSRMLYVGVTSDLTKRVYQHNQKSAPGYTQKYNITHLVYYETTNDVHAAIAREKEIKGWLRRKKIALIEATNPQWLDLSAKWYAEETSPE